MKCIKDMMNRYREIEIEIEQDKIMKYQDISKINREIEEQNRL